jgi:hypothetical protein
MKRKKEDLFSGFLFDTGKNPNRARILKPNPDDPNTLIDEEGNIYDLNTNLIKEKPSEYVLKALEIVKKNYPDEKNITPSHPLVQFYIRQLRYKDKQAKKDSKKKK